MASLLLLLAGLHAHDLRNHPPARDAGYNIRTSLIQPALNTQQEPVQAAANTLYLHVRSVRLCPGVRSETGHTGA